MNYLKDGCVNKHVLIRSQRMMWLGFLIGRLPDIFELIVHRYMHLTSISLGFYDHLYDRTRPIVNDSIPDVRNGVTELAPKRQVQVICSTEQHRVIKNPTKVFMLYLEGLEIQNNYFSLTPCPHYSHTTVKMHLRPPSQLIMRQT